MQVPPMERRTLIAAHPLEIQIQIQVKPRNHTGLLFQYVRGDLELEGGSERWGSQPPPKADAGRCDVMRAWLF